MEKGSGLGGGGCQGGCDRRIEVFGKIHQKENWGVGGEGSGWGLGWMFVGVRVDVVEKLKFLGKFTKKSGGGGFGGVRWGSGWWGGGSGWM